VDELLHCTMNVAMHIRDNAESITPLLDDSRPPSKAAMIFLRQNAGKAPCHGSWPGRPRTQEEKLCTAVHLLTPVASGTLANATVHPIPGVT
jgi:hypothetical protein